MEWRKAWAKNWDDVRYCSDACRKRKVRPVDTALEAAILDLLSRRSAGATICPSEAAKVVGGQGDSDGDLGGDADGDDWREMMEPARRAARRLVAKGTVVITQGGKVVDPSTAKGPIRIRLQ